MSRRIDIGTAKAPFHADLDIILRSNLLVMANSGGGKSWALRRMIEQSFGLVPQIVIDPEGEFSTLRQKFDLVLVGKGGDTPADLRSAQLLAHRLLELGASAVVDLFEMSKAQRPLWVAAFVQALVDAPKKLWRDLLLYVDEAHELAPEAGHGAHESTAEKTCRHALIDFAAKGRKRGYGVVAATQRLGKLSKDFAAELKNAAVGQTFIDIDRERAAGALGIAKADKPKFFIDVKTLAPGVFYVLGRALALEPTLVKIGPVQTEHPEAGRRQSAPPPPTEKIRHLLPQLADLPKEAETKAQTEKELKARVSELERENARLKTNTLSAGPAQIVEKPVLKPADIVRIEKLVDRLEKHRGVMAEVVRTQAERVKESEEAVRVALGNLALQVNQAKPAANGVRPAFVDPGRGPRQAQVVERKVVMNDPTDASPDHLEHEERLPEKSQRMLGALRQNEAMGRTSMPFRNVAIIAGVSPNSGTTRNRKAQLTGGGYVIVQGDNVLLTPKGRAYPLNVNLPPDDPRELLEFWKREIGTEKIAKILEAVVNTGPCTDEVLATAAGMEQSGTFRNYKAALTGRGLMVKRGDGTYEAAEVFN
ncbi:MAG TPA: type IV secretory system conjugative DNA transfer family protein [Vicinamibacterales bacterium]|nr:type IV secretory system conjugative DNA transfer family protein [Vicinamibacterales bacterium]